MNILTANQLASPPATPFDGAFHEHHLTMYNQRMDAICRNSTRIRLVCLFGALACICSLATAQPYWRGLGNGTIGPTSIQTLYGDEASGRLLAGGTFMWITNENDTVLGMGQAAWNGSRWDSLAHRIQPISGNNSAQPTHWFLRYGGDLYACGSFSFLTDEGLWNRRFARLNMDEQRWEALECTHLTTSGLQTLVPKEPQTTLYATGFKGTVCNYPESCVFRYDGQAFYTWEPFELIPSNPDNYIGHVFDFLGHTYITGSFRDPLGPGFVDFLRFDGSAWEHVPGWDAAATIKTISIRNDTLYIGGTFREAGGGPGNLIAYFDGTTWNNMGGGLDYTPVPMSATVLDLEWFNNELYVGGMFNVAGEIPVEGLAVWKGDRWCRLPGDFASNQWNSAKILDITVWRDSLYICGGFISIDGEPIRQVAQYIGGDAVGDCSLPVAVNEQISAPTFTLSPNPTNGTLRLQGLPAEARRLLVRDALGRVVHVQTTNLYQLELGHLPAGTYLVHVLDAGGGLSGQARFVRY
ncbi:MAG: T9SS type A sorting domain-containing protein [Flavobacteriales bacterium]|nr:T9SS type A sorting domain-containing protein [Flavobacteriales bacterium]